MDGRVGWEGEGTLLRWRQQRSPRGLAVAKAMHRSRVAPFLPNSHTTPFPPLSPIRHDFKAPPLSLGRFTTPPMHNPP